MYHRVIRSTKLSCKKTCFCMSDQTFRSRWLDIGLVLFAKRTWSIYCHLDLTFGQQDRLSTNFNNRWLQKNKSYVIGVFFLLLHFNNFFLTLLNNNSRSRGFDLCWIRKQTSNTKFLPINRSATLEKRAELSTPEKKRTF